MNNPITTVGFDADDTLWHNERFYRLTQERFCALLEDHAAADHLAEHLQEAERRNLGRYGYGIKGFVLSMIETAVEVTEGQVPASVIREVLDAGKEMLAHPIDLLPHARETVTAMADRYRVILVTKGDLLDQERKLALSGLGDLFHGVEIVSEKTPEVYAHVFARHGTGADRAAMVGNSMRSDVVPMIAAGGWGVHVPHDLTWAHEHTEAPLESPRFREIAHLGELGGLVDGLKRSIADGGTTG